jgi:hypothetical protein
MLASPGGGLFGFHGDAISGTVEPTSQGALVAQGGGVADEHEKRGLESVLSVLLVAQDAATDAHHHRTVPANERSERDFIAASGESVQQLLIALVLTALRGQALAKATDAVLHRGTTHNEDSQSET